jgi:hypothetical protein
MISIIDDLEKGLKTHTKTYRNSWKNLRTSNRDRYYHKHDTDTFKANIDKTKAQLETALNEISQVKTALSESPRILGRRYRNKTGSDKPDKLDKPDTPIHSYMYLLETL